MSIFQSTILPVLDSPEDTREVRKMGLDLLQKINQVYELPKGFVYLQWTGTISPVILFGGSWTDISASYTGLQGNLWRKN